MVALDEGRGDRRLAAYVVGPSESMVDELRRHLADWVPEYMIPSLFVVLESLPPRLEREDRPPLATGAAERGRRWGWGRLCRAPRTPVEEAVAAIWADVLGVERVGVDDDFFALGGHSLLATQIVAQVRTDFSINLPLHALFSSPTVATLSEQIVDLLGQSPQNETEQLLAELEGLSDEEVARLLDEDKPAGSPPR